MSRGVEVEVESFRPGGGPEIKDFTASHTDYRGPDLEAEYYESAHSFRFSFFWYHDLNAEEVRDMLEEDDAIGKIEVPVRDSKKNRMMWGDERIEVLYTDEQYRVFSDGLPAELLRRHYRETVEEYDSGAFDGMLSALEEELVEL
jgi:hypothetical protein